MGRVLPAQLCMVRIYILNTANNYKNGRYRQRDRKKKRGGRQKNYIMFINKNQRIRGNKRRNRGAIEAVCYICWYVVEVTGNYGENMHHIVCIHTQTLTLNVMSHPVQIGQRPAFIFKVCWLQE